MTIDYKAKISYQNCPVASAYDRSRFTGLKGKNVDRIEKWAINRALKFCNISRNGLVLDVACGTGRIAEYFLERNFTVVGLDYSFEMLNVAKERLRNLGSLKGLCRADAESLPFKEDSFEAMISMRFFGHVPHEIRIRMLKEIGKASKDWIIIAHYHKYSLHTIYRKIRYLFNKNKTGGFPATYREMKEEVRMADLELIKIMPFFKYFLQGHLIIMQKKK